jgi:DNA-3-methyladenine glycosylase II
MNKKNIKPPLFWEKAKKILSLKDKKLSKIIKNYPNDFLYTKSDPFFTLARSIVGQQISVKAAQTIWERLETKIINIQPTTIIKTRFNTLKSIGLSRQKINYLKNLSYAFIEKKINLNSWNKMSDEEIILDLTQIKGIGRWTAEMFLIFNLCRSDIFPLDDIGMIRGLCKLYDIPYPTDKEILIQISEKWKPYRSVATWYLWRSLDPIPVEY